MVYVRKGFAYLFLLLLFLSLFSTLRFNFLARATAIIVPTDFSTIQAAVNNAAPGDTIFVSEGVYYENVVVNKSICLIGENKNTTIIDGKGSGVVVRVVVDNVSLSDFTIQNSGMEADEGGVSLESSFNRISGNIVARNGLTGVYLSDSFGSQIFENIIMDNGGDGILLIRSSNNLLFNNTVTGNKGGVGLYSSNENNISRNIITYDQLGGIYLFYSSNNSLLDNVILCNEEYGLHLDYSSDFNRIIGNVIVGNLKHGLVLGSVYGNVLRNNNMTGNQFNFHAVLDRPNLQDYLNDVDSSNTADGKEIHYIINGKNLTVNFTSYPNIGYLALVNSTCVHVKGLNFTGNGQALLLAFTSNSTIENLKASNNNYGVQLCSSSYITIANCTITNNIVDGVTVDHSSLNNTVASNVIAGSQQGIRVVHSCKNNTISMNNITDNDKGVWIYSHCNDNVITKNLIVSNRIGISLQRSSPSKIVGNTITNNHQGLFLATSGNLIFHNNFVSNTVQVETSNFSSIWDLGYSNGGNYWTDYEGKDANGDDLGDVPYTIDESNVDRYPLVSFRLEEDEEPPAIGFPTCFPSGDVQPYKEVTVYVAVTDVGSGLKNVTLFYTSDNGSSWIPLNMTYNSTVELFTAVVPGQPRETLVKYNIVAFDNAGNMTIKDNSGQFFTYHVIPEFNSLYLLLSLLATTLIVLYIAKNSKSKE